MNEYCSKCKTKNITIKNISKWDKSETIEPEEIKVGFECLECGNNFSKKIIFNSLNEYLGFLDKYEIQ